MTIFSSVITEEKEQMTFGLLKMTGLNPISILLGKSAGQLVSAVLLILVQVPFALLSVALGGVSVRQVLAAYLMLLAFMLFVYGLALVSSTVARRTSGAAGLTVLGLIAFFFVPWIGTNLLREMVRARWIAPEGWLMMSVGGALEWLGSVSISTGLISSATTGFNQPLFGRVVVGNALLAAGLFVLAWLVFNRFTKQELAAAPPRNAPTGRRLRSGRLGPGRAWSASLLWKDFYFLGSGVLGILYRLLLMGLIVGGIGVLNLWQWDREDFGYTCFWVALLFMLLELALQAGRVFATEVRWKTLPDLVMLPDSLARVAYAKVAGVVVSAVIPSAVFMIFALFVTPHLIRNVLNALDEEGLWATTSLAICFLHATAYVSLWVRYGAVGLTLLIFIAAYMIFGGFMALLFMGMGGPDHFETIVIFITICLLALSAVIHPLIGKRLIQVAGR